MDYSELVEAQIDEVFFGEGAALRSQIVDLLGEDWLHAKNVAFGLKSADELIGTVGEMRVRDVLYAISVSALS